MRILWIEDFPKEMGDHKSVAENLFQELLDKKSFTDFPRNKKIHEVLPEYFKVRNIIHEIEICYSWMEYDSLFVRRLYDFDIFIIDINLTSKGMSESEKLKPYLEKVREDEKGSFDKYAGFYIYNDIILKGVSEINICLLTANSDDLKAICYQYAIPVPNNMFTKDHSGYTSFRKWLQSKAYNNYIQLRRGILDGCDFFLKNEYEILLNRTLKKDGDGEKIDKLSPEYGKEFLIRLQGILHKEFYLEGKELTQKLYTFLMTLSAEWERGESKDEEQKKHFEGITDKAERTFYETTFWILSNLRNCFAHFTFDKENIKEQDIAFFFIIAVHGFFKMDMNKIESHERILLSILPKENKIITKEQIEKQNHESFENVKKLFEDYRLKEAWQRNPKKDKQPAFKKEPSDYNGFALRVLDACKQNHNDKLKPTPKTVIQKQSKLIFYNAYLYGMEEFFTEAVKDKLFYKLANFVIKV